MEDICWLQVHKLLIPKVSFLLPLILSIFIEKWMNVCHFGDAHFFSKKMSNHF